MILRKPYALLIKHFKKIHVVLCAVMVYLVFASSNILTFLNRFIATGTFERTPFSLSSTYLNSFMFIAGILVIGIAVIIYILMRQKNKPKLLYLIIIAFYIILMIFFFQMYNVFGTLEISNISPREIRIVRDIATILTYSQYVIIVLIAIRAVGFNIKKFNFGEDLAELEIDVTDNEEFELTVGVDQAKIKRHLRRSKRELKYFIVENAFVLSLISFFVIAVGGTLLYLNFAVYNKIYKQAEPFKIGYFINTVNNSYYTRINQKGINIAPKDKAYIISNITVTNNDVTSQRISLDDINLVYGNNVISPNTNRYYAFADLGEGYTKQLIKAKESKTFIVVFEVDEKINLNKLTLRYRKELRYNNSMLEAKYERVKLKITNVNDVKKIAEATIPQEMSFKDSPLGDSKLKIDNVEIADKFTYDAKYCYNDLCNTVPTVLTLQFTTTQKDLMKLSFVYVKDDKTSLINSNNLSSLINSYAFLRYKIGNKTYDADLVNKTPSNYDGKDLFYQVPSTLKDANSSEIIIRIRDKEFIYKLK